MKSKNTPIISVVIPPSQESELTLKWAEDELVGLPHEIFLNNWKTGLNKAVGEYVCFLERDCVLTPEYFINLLAVFEEKPSFRKLAVVAPTVGINSYNNRSYGIRIATDDAYPAYLPSSNSPYLIQAAYLPGALIRRSSLQSAPREPYILLDSVGYSLNFWGSGQRIMLDPATLYVTTNIDAGEPFDIVRTGRSPEITAAIEMFRREAIG